MNFHARRRRPPAWLAKSGLVVASFVAFLIVAECALRLCLRASWGAEEEDERRLMYRHDAKLGWFPVPGSRHQITASRMITAAHNRDGFRDPEFRPDGRPGILILGDSLVWGFDVEASERFTDLLRANHPEWNVYNLGVSGYGTDQEYLILQEYFEQLRARLVILVVCGDNDNDDNAWNCRGGYYKPWFTLDQGALKLNGTPVPKSDKVIIAEHRNLCWPYLARIAVRAYCRWRRPSPARVPEPPTGAILLDMNGYVTRRGARFAVGLQHANVELEQFLARFGIPQVTLEATNAGDFYAGHGKHWTPQGHAVVATRIEEFLRREPLRQP